MQKSELKNRLVYGSFALGVAAVAIYVGGVAFYLLVIISALIAALEFDKLRGDGKVAFLYCLLPLLFAYSPFIAIVLVGLSVLMIFAAQYPAEKYDPWLAVSVVYISVPAVTLLWLRFMPDGLQNVIWLMLVVVAMDVGAFFVGRKYGKTLLAPGISPKKTWEGLVGGASCAALMSWVYTGRFGFVLIGLVFAVMAVAGDLLESAVKRRFGVKDTGNILPGHGGVMDRTDSFVLTAPLAAAAYYLGIFQW